MSDATYTYRDTDAMVELQLVVLEVSEGVNRLIVGLEDCDLGGHRVTAWLPLDEGRRMADTIENGMAFEFADPSDDLLTVEHGTLHTTIGIVCGSFIPVGEEPARVSIRLASNDAVVLLAELRSLCGPKATPPVNDALVKARDAARGFLKALSYDARPQWRQCFTDVDAAEHPNAIGPVCLDEEHDPEDPTAYPCCPEPVIEVEHAVIGAYLVELLNADAEDGAP